MNCSVIYIAFGALSAILKMVLAVFIDVATALLAEILWLRLNIHVERFMQGSSRQLVVCLNVLLLAYLVISRDLR